MNVADALVSLQAMAPHLSSAEISNIFNSKCSQDFNKSLDYLLAMAKHTNTTEIKTDESTNNNHSNTNTNETYIKQKHSMDKQSKEYKNSSDDEQKNKINFQKDFRSNLKEEQLQIIDRIGRNLAKLSIIKNRENEQWMKAVQIQMMDDLASIKKEIIGSSADMDYQIYCYLVNEYFHGQECEAYECLSMKNNGRDRLQTSNTFTVLNRLDAIHVSLLHGYDTGHKLYASERLALQSMPERMDEQCLDLEAEHIRQMISGRKERHKWEMNDLRSQTQKNLNSKFVTVVNAVVDENQNSNNNNIQSSDQKNNEINDELESKKTHEYRFGYKFYYHSKFENNTKIDTAYNGGTFPYNYWYIPQKYSSMKEELLKEITIIAFDEEWDNANTWMDTKYVKDIVFDDEYQGNDYNITKNTAISVFHILSLLVHCNFTKLCTSFSSAFRKLNEYESDVSLKARNREMREFSRLLVECVHVYGTRLSVSDIQIFFHGVSLVMQFPANVGRFCSPTSTTTEISVAINFAGTGIVLELINNKSHWMTYFDCCILSDFGNEAEKLFFQGGFSSSIVRLEYIALTFNSIRNIKLSENYEYFVIAISCLEVMISGLPAEWNKLQLMPKHVKCLRRLLDDHKICEYVLKMYHSLINNTTNISLFACAMNRNDNENYFYFKLFRDIFCELYSAEELAANKEQWTEDIIYSHKKGFIQPIISFKFDFIFNLFSNLKTIEIHYLPLTHRLLEYILNLEIWTDMKRMGISIEIRVENGEYEKQSNFRGSEKYNECVSFYSQQFSQKGLKVSLNDRKDGIIICFAE